MSRTHHTDPYLLRHARLEGRKIPKDWRDRWDFRNCPVFSRDPEGWESWWNDRPGERWIWWDHRPTRLDRRIGHKRMRQAVRASIKHEDYDRIPTRMAEVWDWWTYL